jgi:bifunctional DNA-binding transcriptional regulator/antitoxin component of YhaV-PrlF toxin-antitoxin module
MGEPVDGIDVEVEQRRRLGLPSEALEAAGLRPGDRATIQVNRYGRLTIVPMTDLVEKYSGAVPGLSATTDLRESRGE